MLHKQDKFYVYLHRRPGDVSPFYVGKGKGQRAGSLKGRNAHWRSIVGKHGGFDVEIVEIFESEDDAFACERFLIASLKTFGIRLANKSIGGEGAAGVIPSLEHRMKISRALKGATRSDETKQRMRESYRNRDAASREAVIDGRRRRFSKPLICVDNGMAFSSLVDAASWLRANGFPAASTSALSSCCRGKHGYARAYGYQWKYLKKENEL